MSEECTHDCSSCGASCDHNAEAKDLIAPLNKDSAIKHVYAIMSGKGGVGKSSTTACLASAMAKKGYKVGIMDADITGPSIPTAFGLNTRAVGDGESIFPMDFNFFGLNLADTPSIKHPGLIWIIPILSGLTAFLSSYIMQKMQNMPKGNDAAANQMKMMTMLMPLMSLYFAFILPGAIGIYWIFNNVFTCVQEVILTKRIRGRQEAEQAAEAERVAAEKKAKREANRAAQKSHSEKKKGDK